MDINLVKQYAEFAVKIGVNPQPGQTLIIRAPIEGAFFARACAEAAYAAGAKEVVVHYSDEKLSRIKMENTAVEVLEDVKPWLQRSYLDYVESEGGACMLSISARDPEIYKGLDMEKIDRANQAAMKAQEEWRSYTMSDKVQWSIVAIPSAAWAGKVFPGAAEDEAQEMLWDAIFDVCRVKNGNVVSEWQAHVKKMTAWRDRMNALDLDSIRLQSANGTDLTIGLADGHVWEGAQSRTPEGYTFIANIPTEEVFTAPHKDKVEGVVYGTKPYVFNGQLIKNFHVRFEQGRVVEHGTLEDIFDHTLHPYTEGLFNSLPNMADRTQRLKPIKGLMPDPSNLPEGCAFCPRCNYAKDICARKKPGRLWSNDTHYVECHLYNENNIRNGEVLKGE